MWDNQIVPHLPQPVHVTLLALGFTVIALILTLGQRLGEWRSKTVARILGILAFVLILCWVYVVLLWIFQIDLVQFAILPVGVWWIVGLGSVITAVFAARRTWFRKKSAGLASSLDKSESLAKRYAMWLLPVAISAFLAVAIWFVVRKALPLPPDEVTGIENKLAHVPDPAYRQLVASVIGAFDPNAEIDSGALLSTPDGRRSVDVAVRSSRDKKPTLTAIDILYLPLGQKVGIEAVDAADSKRTDIKADAMLLCSNTGFDEEAISKAKRKNIGLVSILRQGDKRVKAIIEEEIYLRKVKLEDVRITWKGDDLQNLNPDDRVLDYNGGSVPGWMILKSSLLATMNPDLVVRTAMTFRLKQPTIFYKNGKRLTLRSMTIAFTPVIHWFSETVRLDAKAGIYDYIRGRLVLTPGLNTYTVSGINFDRAKPLSSAPPSTTLGVGLLKPGEIDTSFVSLETSPETNRAAKLDDLIQDEDLRLQLTASQLDEIRRNSQLRTPRQQSAAPRVLKQ
jgi:hypothetical protein